MPLDHCHETLMRTAVIIFVLSALDTSFAQTSAATLPSVPLHHISVNGMLSDGAWISADIGGMNVSVLLGEKHAHVPLSTPPAARLISGHGAVHVCIQQGNCAHCQENAESAPTARGATCVTTLSEQVYTSVMSRRRSVTSEPLFKCLQIACTSLAHRHRNLDVW